MTYHLIITDLFAASDSEVKPNSATELLLWLLFITVAVIFYR